MKKNSGFPGHRTYLCLDFMVSLRIADCKAFLAVMQENTKNSHFIHLVSRTAESKRDFYGSTVPSKSGTYSASAEESSCIFTFSNPSCRQ